MKKIILALSLIQGSLLAGAPALAKERLVEVRLSRPTVYEYPNSALISLIAQAEAEAKVKCGSLGILRSLKATTPREGWYPRAISAVFTFECE